MSSDYSIARTTLFSRRAGQRAGAPQWPWLAEASDGLLEGRGDLLVARLVGVDVGSDGRWRAHPGPLTDPGDVERHGPHAGEGGGVGEVGRAEGGLHVSDRDAESREAGAEQRVERHIQACALLRHGL